tara:strand:- start:578 stop:1111 length:534 start_codon:yes stop_codon:yes gene_type:complete
MNKENLRALARKTHTAITRITGTSSFTISGGFLRDNLNSEETSDIDCFFIDRKKYDKAVNGAINSGCTFIKERKNSQQFLTAGGKTIDLIFTYEGYVFDFDFTMNMISYDFGNDKLLLSPEVEKHILDKVLIIKTNKLPIGLIERAKKFYDRGWGISRETKVKLMNNYLDGVNDATY